MIFQIFWGQAILIYDPFNSPFITHTVFIAGGSNKYNNNNNSNNNNNKYWQ